MSELVGGTGGPRRAVLALAVGGLIGLNLACRLQLIMPWFDTTYPSHPDQWGYQTLGYLWAHMDLLPYRDVESENKTPGIWLVYRFCTAHWGTSTVPPTLLAAAAGTATALILLWAVARRWGWGAGLAAALLWTLTAADTRMNAVFAFTEIFATCFSTAAWALLLLPADKRTNLRVLLAGALFGGAFLFKQPWVLEMLGAVACLLVLEKRDGPRSALFAILGFATSVLAMGWYLASLGILGDAWRVCIVGTLLGPQNDVPLFETGYLAVKRLGDYVLPGVTWFVPFSLGIPRLLARRPEPCIALLRVWGISALLGAISARKLRGYQLLEVMVPVCVIGALGLQHLRQLLQHHAAPQLRRSLAVAAVWILISPMGALISESSESGAMWIWTKAKVESPDLSDKLRVADLVRAHTDPSDSVFAWEVADWVHMLADRRPASRYTHGILGRRSAAVRAQIAADLIERPPQAIILCHQGSLHWSGQFPQLDAMLQSSYAPLETVGPYRVYERRARAPTPSESPRAPVEPDATRPP